MTEHLLVVCEDGLNAPAASYALGTLLELLGFRYRLEEYSIGETVYANGAAGVIAYGHTAPAVIGAPSLYVKASTFFDRRTYLTRASLPHRPADDGTACFFQSNGSGTPEPDFIASTFFLLTGYEEFVSAGKEDKRGRRMAASSALVSAGLLQRPLVHEYAAQLNAGIQRSLGTSIVARPDPFSPKLVITRDIDSLHKERQGIVSRATRRVRRHLARGTSTGPVVPDQNEHNNLDTICDWEAQLGVRSSMYFMSSHSVGDANYSVTDSAIARRLQRMQRDGWEIGFHPGTTTFVDGQAFRNEQQKLAAAAGTNVYGGRQHGLRFRVPYTWRHWEDGGFTYDSSVGYAEREGFRSGICVPYRPFDLLENRTMRIWELPLTVMDCTLDKYRRLPPEEAGRVLDELARTVARCKGVFVLLWHNTYFGRANCGAFHDVFAGFVERALRTGVSPSRAIDVVHEWQNRSRGLRVV